MEWKRWYIHIWSNRLVRYGGMFVGLGKEAYGFGFWPFLVVRSNLKNAPVLEELINHEKIHLRQQLEMLILFAEILYIVEFLYGRYILKLSKKEAYYFISLEQEAHINAPNQNYLKNRKLFALIPYLFNKRKIYRDVSGSLVVVEKTKRS